MRNDFLTQLHNLCIRYVQAQESSQYNLAVWKRTHFISMMNP